MTNSKWIRRALLGGVAMAVMATGAQADDLSDLKAQIEALQARVNTIESRGAALPEGVSLITFQRGSKEIAMVGGDDTKLIDKAPEGRGFTIAITPTADLPAPATEITLSGSIRTLALWGKSKISNVPAGSTLTAGSDNDFDLAARGTLNIRSKTDTAVGQVRTRIQIRNQFSGFGFRAPAMGAGINDPVDGDATTTQVEARLAYGEWDFMPGWTLLAGHAGQIAAVTNVAYPTQPAMYGLDSTRHNQIRLTYSGGPISFGVGIENPSRDNLGGLMNSTTVPDFAGFAQFNAPGGISLRVTGEAGKVGDSVVPGTNTGYLVGVGAAASIAQINLNAGFVYTKGLGCDSIFSAAGGYCRVGTGGAGLANNTGVLAKGYGAQVNAGVGLTETVSANASFGYFNYTNLIDIDDWDHGFSVGGNIVWRPVEALQVAAEVDYFNAKTVGGAKGKTFVGGLGFWFFF